MSTTVQKINRFFKTALKTEVEEVKIQMSLSDRQLDIFERFYIKKQDINFIADTLCVCPQVINKELRNIRMKLIRLI